MEGEMYFNKSVLLSNNGEEYSWLFWEAGGEFPESNYYPVSLLECFHVSLSWRLLGVSLNVKVVLGAVLTFRRNR